MRLVFPRELFDWLISVLRGCSVERVFFCTGLRAGDGFFVEECVECPNVSETPRVAFTADPQCTYRVVVGAEERGRLVAAIAHCHPAAPRPSLLDLKGMRLWRIPWLIVDSVSGGYAVWLLGEDGGLVEVAVETV